MFVSYSVEGTHLAVHLLNVADDHDVDLSFVSSETGYFELDEFRNYAEMGTQRRWYESHDHVNRVMPRQSGTVTACYQSRRPVSLVSPSHT
jgi:hypothetical protein